MQAAVLGVGDCARHLMYLALPTEMDTLLRQSLGFSPRADGARVLSQSTLSLSRVHHASLDTIDEGWSLAQREFDYPGSSAALGRLWTRRYSHRCFGTAARGTGGGCVMSVLHWVGHP